MTVAQLADEYFERRILGRWKHPNIVRSRIENDIKPNMGKMKAEDVKPRDVDNMLQTIVKRGAPTMANDVLRWTKRIFDFAIKRHVIQYNPASAFDIADAGGKEETRDRWLTREEIIKLFQAMKDKAGTLTIENHYAVRLLLLLAVRKKSWFPPLGRSLILMAASGTCRKSAPRPARRLIFPCHRWLLKHCESCTAWPVVVPTFSGAEDAAPDDSAH